MQTRIYVVECSDGAVKLIEATSAAQAISHWVRGHYRAHVATTKEVAKIMLDDVHIEHAHKKDEEVEKE